MVAAGKIDRESNTAIIGTNRPSGEPKVFMARGERADVKYDFLNRSRDILAAHNQRIRCAAGKAVLVKVTVVHGGNAGILLRQAGLQFRGKLIRQRLNGRKPRGRIGVLGGEIFHDARITAVTKPVVIVNSLMPESCERLRHDRSNRRSRRWRRIGRGGVNEGYFPSGSGR